MRGLAQARISYSFGVPHRALTYVPRCVVCERQTKKKCTRCGLPLCKEHLPPRNRRCDACEADYETRERNLPVKGGEASLSSVPHGAFLTGLVASIGASALGITAMVLQVPAEVLWIILAVLGFFGIILIAPAWALSTLAAGSAKVAGAGYAHVAHTLARKKFMKERKVAPKQLEAGTVGASPGRGDAGTD